MGIQIVIRAADIAAIESTLGELSASIEIFPVHDDHFGVSIPTRVVDDLGEQVVFGSLSRLAYFDLWAGRWRQPKPRWKFW